MSFDVTTLALAKSYTNQHSGGADGEHRSICGEKKEGN